MISAFTGTILGFACGAGTALAVSLAVKKMNSSREKRISLLESDADRSRIIRSAVDSFKKSSEFRLIKQAEYNRGFNDGTQNTLADFSIEYQKFENIEEKFFSSIVETGYFMQLTYKGIPVGGVTKRIVHAGKKVDRKRVDGIIAMLDETVKQLIEAAAAGKIPIKQVRHLITKK